MDLSGLRVDSEWIPGPASAKTKDNSVEDTVDALAPIERAVMAGGVAAVWHHMGAVQREWTLMRRMKNRCSRLGSRHCNRSWRP